MKKIPLLDDAFSYGFCSCYKEPVVCIASCFCAPCQNCLAFNALVKGMEGWTGINCLYGCFCPLCMLCHTRYHVHKGFSFVKLLADLCVGAFCCAPCGLCQHANESKSKGKLKFPPSFKMK